MKNVVGNRIADVIWARRYLHRDAAKLAGIHPSTLSTYITGRAKPSLRAIEKLAAALNVNPAYLAGWCDKM